VWGISYLLVKIVALVELGRIVIPLLLCPLGPPIDS